MRPAARLAQLQTILTYHRKLVAANTYNRALHLADFYEVRKYLRGYRAKVTS